MKLYLNKKKKVKTKQNKKKNAWLTRPWLLSLNRVKSWLEVSKRVLQISSNHSRRGPPQSRATEKQQDYVYLLQNSYSGPNNGNLNVFFTFLILKHNLKVLTPVRHREVPRGLQGLQEINNTYKLHVCEWKVPSVRKAALTESRIECRVIFRQVLVRGFLEWMCLSSRWKKFTLSWKVSEPPTENDILLPLKPLPHKTVELCLCHTNQCSCAGNGWKWQPWCSCLCS